MAPMAASDSFVHLHVHTDYSMLDGAGKISSYVAEAARQEMSALAITDHGYMFGVYEFYNACKKAGIKPIIGVEAYMTPGTSRFDKTRVFWGDESQRSDDVSARGSYTHMTLLSRNNEGLHNLMRLDSYASLEGQWGKSPRMDRELLSRYSKGLIGTTACPSGEVQTRLRLGQYDEALRAAGEFQDIFGKDFFYVEIMDHGLEIERRVTKDLLRLAADLNAPLLATNDSHYVKPTDREVQDAMLCINSGSVLSDPDRFKFDGDSYYLRPAAEMRKLFADFPGACDNTLLVAQQCDIHFTTTDEGANYMPVFDVPEGETDESWFIKECWKGMDRRFNGNIPEECRKQAEYEIGVIVQMGFPGYFLVVADYINWAKRHGIRVGPGRGSGAGSMVAYAMGITELNPLEHGLIFERFLNPERISMPDIDVDFDERRRDEVIEYVRGKYGSDRVSQVVTYGVIKAKQALKDSARVMGYPYAMGERLTKAMPPGVQGKDIPVNGIFDKEHERYGEAEEFRKLYEEDADVKRIVGLARGLEGMTRQWGVHACAVIMSSKTLTDVIPMMQRVQDGAVITQFDYPTCETLGLLKMDFLGLRNLTVISDALVNITGNGKPALDIDNVPLDDKKTYELLSRGETLGVFQLDGGGMRTLLRLMRPDNFEDISAVGALYRPGPMGADSHTKYALRKNGVQKIEAIHPELAQVLEPILSTTYGLIVYQEQVMQIAQKLAGFSMGKADKLRKAMGKKLIDKLNHMYPKFIKGGTKKGYDEKTLEKIWNDWRAFASYAFNKSHAACYAWIAYQTGYLKAHYPAQFMAGDMNSWLTNITTLTKLMDECKRLGIDTLGPDINESMMKFSVNHHSQIRFGLAAIKGCGEAAMKNIIAERKKNGVFKDIYDFVERIDLSSCNKKNIENLATAGAFDSFGIAREQFVEKGENGETFIDILVRYGQQFQMENNTAQNSLFGDFNAIEISKPMIPQGLPEWSNLEKLNKERDLIGIYISGHPLDNFKVIIEKICTTRMPELEEVSALAKRDITFGGIITNVRTGFTKKNGNPYGFVTIEDYSGSGEIAFWGEDWARWSGYMNIGNSVFITAFVGPRRYNQDEYEVQVRKVEFLGDVKDKIIQRINITIHVNRLDQNTATELASIMSRDEGHTEVIFHVYDDETKMNVQLMSQSCFALVDTDLITFLEESPCLEYEIG